MRDGDWYIGYFSYDNHPGAALHMGRQSYGIDCITEPTVKFAEPSAADAPLPGEDGIRLGRDYQRTATVTMELAVDAVDGPVDRHYPMRPWAYGSRVGDWTDFEALIARMYKKDGPEAWASEGVDMLRQVWDAEGIRSKPSRVAWLLHKTAGRTRRLYGRPRNFDVAHSRLLKQGYVPCVAEFVSVDGRFYDEIEQSVELWDFYLSGRTSRPWRPISKDGQTYFQASRKTATIQQKGRLKTFPVIVVHGPCKNPKITSPRLWSVQLGMTIADGEYVTIDPRPWTRTVIHTAKNGDTKSVADKLTRASPRLAEMAVPTGRWPVTLSYTRTSSTYFAGPRVEIKWRDAHAWW